MKVIKEIRKSRSFSQAALARMAGISQSVLSDIENGKISPTVRVFTKIAKALNVPPSHLLDREESA
jgi:transcriptional regulator with XRE-family HTH domain